MDDPWDDVRAAGEWLLSLEREIQPDLVHLNGYCHGTLDWDCPVLVVAHSCVLSWWAAVKKEGLPEKYREYASRVEAGLSAASHVVAPSHAMLDALRRHYAGFGRGSVIHNGRHEQPFPCGHQAALRSCRRAALG